MSMGQSICVLSDDQAVEILRNLHQRGYSIRDLEKLLGVVGVLFTAFLKVCRSLQRFYESSYAKSFRRRSSSRFLKVETF